MSKYREQSELTSRAPASKHRERQRANIKYLFHFPLAFFILPTHQITFEPPDAIANHGFEEEAVMAIFCTDAGHGGTDSGAAWQNVLEKELNLRYVLAFNDELKKGGHHVWTT
ncbi:MAG: N-acetylmuramoyl-L-alanine amidase, partial [Calditrichaeota bacterium]|nr:N-acetylmuramoyl-L-alanine amidase [Calditrichota bacterium]